MTQSMETHVPNGIALIGMAGRFPGAATVEDFWRNLSGGVESITFFSDEELERQGITRSLLEEPTYVKAASVLDDIECFDAAFFDIPAREAMVMDPQQRLFLECAWAAMEDSGYDPSRYEGLIGVFGGASLNGYLIYNLATNPFYLSSPEGFQALIANEKDYLATRVSYKLNLRGPSVAVQTACSTSMVAVHLACQSLLTGECDLALAGGVSVKVPHRMGYFHQEGMPFSTDGHCRTFDAKSSGTVFGSGVGIVVLKRVADAVADRDNILAVIRGSAMNNDGSLRIGFTAPSPKGQAEVISQALAMAEVAPATIGYVETHGTGTPLGDPIEIEALTQVFRNHTDRQGFCAVGSVKTNVGHLETAAGVTSLIKVALMLRHRSLVPSLWFESPNPQIAFATSPFYVCREHRDWPAIAGDVRRAGISSFGMGGTNVHAVLEEAPAIASTPSRRPYQLITVSAKTATALVAATANLAEFLRRQPAADLADVAYTLHLGRRDFAHRRIAVCSDVEDARRVLESGQSDRLFSSQCQGQRTVAFMFAGAGSQYVDMCRGLYDTEPLFRDTVDYCTRRLQTHLGFNLAGVLYPSAATVEEAGARLQQPDAMFPVMFAVQYALATLLQHWGVRPKAMIGHSHGEYVAACLAGVFSLDDALELVSARAKLLAQLEPGAMAAVPLPVARVEELLAGDMLSIAAVNDSASCVVSGATDALERFCQRLQQEHKVDCQRLRTRAGLHSYLVEAVRERFVSIVRRFPLHEPQIPYLSSVTGTWITAAEATDPDYWGRHLRQTVRFADGISKLLKDSGQILLDLGPGQAMSAMTRQNLEPGAGRIIVAATRRYQDDRPDAALLLEALGRLWLTGGQVDWSGFYQGEQRRRLALPTYPFERKRYWIEAGPTAEEPKAQFERWTAAASEPPASESPAATATTGARSHLLNAYVPPQSDLEKEITQLWQRFFGFDEIGIHDNFFELGGTSLLAAQITNSIKKTFGIQLSLATFVRTATVAGLATTITRLRAEQAESRTLQALERLENLSDTEIKRMLAERKHRTKHAGRRWGCPEGRR
ncbi:MAG: beta-ketoacyl synthase N-terminal-like domain-containing protein [Candidatus Competibacteraceae bacterium]